MMEIAVIYMASGFGKRFGGNKLLHLLCGKPLYQHGLDQVQEAVSRLEQAGEISCQLIVVSQYAEIVEACCKQGIEARLNQHAATGITASIRVGIEAAGPVDAYAFFVADQPLLQAATIAAFLSGYSHSGKSLGCMKADSHRGNPSIFAAPFKAELLSLKGDKGGSSILQGYADENLWLCPAESTELMDIDTREMVAKAAAFIKASLY